ncbi:MAG TPA: SPFH domain-containing protein [Candidatus Scybalocola faecipullorum]|nr:SPFH domain-containing protein [Candidatus Scybalocola faecipullorum]
MSEGKDRVFKEEKIIHPSSGFGMLFLTILLILASIGGIVAAAFMLEGDIIVLGTILMIISIIVMCLSPILFAGLKVLHPNEALVLTLFGKYYGTIEDNGFYFVNPFCTAVNPASSMAAISVAAAAAGKSTGNTGTSTLSKKVSLKAMTLNNEQQKVNDEMGNPIIIGAIVIWKVESATKAVFNVQNYKTFLSIQCDSIIRNVARRYPYDTNEGGDEKSLRGSSQEVADIMKQELQEKVIDAGLKIVEVKITHLSYAPEIASAMLQRQQAAAIIDARQKIVEGAVGMVEMALSKLNENDIVQLDEERKAAMVSNLLVVLCGNKDAQPIVNSGSLY